MTAETTADRSTGTRAIGAIALVCLAALAQFHLRQILTASILYDDAHNANVAKNLAFGFGYSTSYHEVVPFDPAASTGPVVLLPAAAFVRLFGNQYWVPTFSIVVCIWATLALVLWLLRAYLAQREWLAFTALLAFGLLLYDADEFGLLGDVPAAFLVVAAILILCRPGRGLWPAFAAGLVLGLAIETKLFAALVLVPACVYLFVAAAEGAFDVFVRVRAPLALGFGVVIPLIARQAWQFVATGFSPRNWASVNARQMAFVETWSGARNFRQSAALGRAMLDHLSAHTTSLVECFNGWPSLVLFPAALAVSVGAIVRTRADNRRSTAIRAILLVLLGAGGMHVFWWYAFELEGWYRHLLPGVLYFLVAAAVAVVSSFRVSRNAGAWSLALLLLSWVPQWPNLRLVFGRFEREPRLTALFATRDEMVKLQSNSDLIFVGYGWWVPRDLEYLLPTVGNFKDARRLQPGDVKGKRIVLVRNEYFNKEHSVEERAFQVACERHTLFARDPFIISECPSLPAETRAPRDAR